jgi:CBS domain-containing protein
MFNEEVRKIMTTDIITVHPDDKVKDVSDLMVKNRYQQVPVTDNDGKLVGMVTSYDLWKNLREGTMTPDQKVSEVMTENVIKIAPIDKVGTAAELFMDRRFKTLPVVNLNNELKGVLTAFDVIRHTLKEEYPVSILYAEVINRDN